MLWRRLALLNAAIIGVIVAVMCFISIRTTTELIYSEQESTCTQVVDLGTSSMSDFFSTLKSRTLGLAINDDLQSLLQQVTAGVEDEALTEQFPRFGKVIRNIFFDANHVTISLYAPGASTTPRARSPWRQSMAGPTGTTPPSATTAASSGP